MDIPKNINDLINYQEGSVVSREIVKKPSGIISLFAFEIEQGLKMCIRDRCNNSCQK